MTTIYVLLEGVNLYETLLDTQDLSTVRGASHTLLSLPEKIDELLKTPTLKRKLPSGWSGEAVMAAASKGLYKLSAPDACTPPLTEKAAVDLLRGWLSSETADPRFFTQDHKSPPVAEKDEDLPALNTSLKWQVASHMSWVVVAQNSHVTNPETGASEALTFSEIYTALNDKKADQQYQSLTCDLPRLDASIFDQGSPHGQLPCSIDGVRPRSAFFWRSMDVGGVSPSPMSLAVATRRCLGRGGRRKHFYNELLQEAASDKLKKKLAQLYFADDFGELVLAPPKDLPEAIAGKMAVLMMDGNAMGSAIAQQTATEQQYADYSKKVSLERAKIGAALLQEAIDNPLLHVSKAEFLQINKAGKRVFAEYKDGVKRNVDALAEQEAALIRLETLMWGGDEMAFVFPAWGLQGVLKALCGALPNGANIKDAQFTYAIGVALCHHKTPIQEVYKLADNLTSAIKAAKKSVLNGFKHETLAGQKLPDSHNLLQIYTLGHIDLPAQSLSVERLKLYKAPEMYPKNSPLLSVAQPSGFSLDGKQFDTIMGQITAIKGISGKAEEGIPRERIVTLLQTMIAHEALFLTQEELKTKKEVVDEIVEFANTLQKRGYKYNEQLLVPNDVAIKELNDALAVLKPCLLTPELNGDPMHPLVPLLHIVALWPYAGLEAAAPKTAQSTPAQEVAA